VSERLLYFGYGVNRDPKFLSTLLGVGVSDLSGQPATLQDYKLAVQRLDQVPDSISDKAPIQISPRTILERNWKLGEFASYCVIPSRASQVSGVIWSLTPEQRERIRDWELADFGWFKDCVGIAITNEGKRLTVVTEKLGEGQDFDRIVDGLDYETWLANPGKYIRLAEIARTEYNERIKGTI
jgi:hypothetical protein